MNNNFLVLQTYKGVKQIPIPFNLFTLKSNNKPGSTSDYTFTKEKKYITSTSINFSAILKIEKVGVAYGHSSFLECYKVTLINGETFYSGQCLFELCKFNAP